MWQVAAAANAVILVAFSLTYWSMRRSYRRLLHEGPLVADRKARRRRALEIHDNIVQGLALAQYRYEVGQPELAHEAVVKTLAAARTMMSELVQPESGMAIEPGDLVRSVPAQASAPDDRARV